MLGSERADHISSRGKATLNRRVLNWATHLSLSPSDRHPASRVEQPLR